MLLKELYLIILIAASYPWLTRESELAPTSSFKQQILCARSSLLYCHTGVIHIWTAKNIHVDSPDCPSSSGGVDCSNTNVQTLISESCNGKGQCDTGPYVNCDKNFNALDILYTCQTTKKVFTCDGGGHSNVQRLQCGPGEGVLSILSAKYSHDNPACAPANDPVKHPAQCSLTPLPQRCDWRSQCESSVVSLAEPCPGLPKHLETTYTCVPAKSLVACDGQPLTIDCGQDVIKILYSNEGRRDLTTCNRGWRKNQFHCYSEKTFSHMANRCDGKTRCTEMASSPLFSEPCPGIFKYLEVSFTCLPAERTITCEGSFTTLACDHGAIKIHSATFGRSDKKICSEGRLAFQTSNDKCGGANDVMGVSEKCDGKTTCDLHASNGVFGDPCTGTYKYLDVRYSCVPFNPWTDLHSIEFASHLEARSLTIEQKLMRLDITAGSPYSSRERLVTSLVRVIITMLHKELYLIILIAASYPWWTSADEPLPFKQQITCARTPLLQCHTGVIKIWNAEYTLVDSPDCPFSTAGINCPITLNVQTLISESCNGEEQCDTGPIIECGRQYNALDIRYTCHTPKSSSIACEQTSLTIDCGQDVIKILSSNYGRTDRTTCIAGRPSNQIQKTDCHDEKAFAYMAKRCDGKTQCSAVASNSVFSDPCGGTFKYLEVSYTCQPSGGHHNGAPTTTPTKTKPTTTPKPTTKTTATTTTTTTVKPNEGFCAGKADGLYANPEDSSSFYQCAQGGRTFLTSCGPNLVFRESCKCCDWKQPTEFCVGKADGIYANPEDESSFYQCANGRTFLQNCNANLVFRESCQCCDRKPVTEFCAGKSDGLHANPEDQSTFYQCAHGTTHLQNCAPTLVFRESCKCCDWPCDGRTQCSTVASNSVFSDPCYGTFKYLEVSYTCISPELSSIVCEHKSLTIDCGQDVIKILSSNYGRTDNTTCIAGRPSGQIKKTDCHEEKAFAYMAERCDGRTQCSALASNSVFSDPCRGTFKYLEVSYTCLPSGQDVIKILSSNYGRTDNTTCIAGRPSGQIKKTDCHEEKTYAYMAQRCDGRTQCSALASNSVFSDPCYGTFKYLEVSYTCLSPELSSIACEHKSLTIDCGQDVIKILSSNYGRTDRTTCIAGRPSRQIQKTDCHEEKAFAYMAKRCDGKTQCSAVASNSVFSDPCGGTFKYLEVSYTCLSPGN
ncbi:uncharacterized protein LOC134457490 [Engraulis encrasicolus]|uniref:uncharacterized protein LOC134457490 n=1 Tax=Engraulis encrasicolus TaxID=184585 RepID=UPI002FD2B75D